MENYKQLNGTAETQLLSTSMHKTLFKIKDKSKVAKSLLKLNRHGYSKDSTRNVHLRRDKKMSYCPNGRNTVLNPDDNGKWAATNRQVGRYGKILKKLVTEQVPNLGYKEKDIEDLVNHIKAEIKEGDFSVVSGKGIAYWYDQERVIEEDNSSLRGSCMGDKREDFFDIYSYNPDIVQMIILVKNDQLVGRALLWMNKWMDRVYGHDHIIKIFEDYAKENGYNHKLKQSYQNKTDWVSPSGETFNEIFTIKLDTDFDEFPYIDTFTYGGNGFLTNSYNSSECHYCYEDTGGGRGGSDYEEEDYDEDGNPF